MTYLSHIMTTDHIYHGDVIRFNGAEIVLSLCDVIDVIQHITHVFMVMLV